MPAEPSGDTDGSGAGDIALSETQAGSAGVATRAHEDPRVRAYIEAERVAYDDYDVEYSSRRIEIPALDVEIRVLEVGTGPPLVIVPGGEGGSIDWLPLLPHLDGHTVYLMDRPGGGLSGPIDHDARPFREQAVAALDHVLDALDLEAPPLVGNSMGGLWALRYALARPDRAGPIALLGCPGLYPGTSAPFPMRLASLPAVGPILVDRLFRPSDPAAARDGLRFQGHPPETRNRLPESIVEAAFRRAHLPHFVPSWVGVLRQTVRLRGARPTAALTTEDLTEVESPVSLLWGRADPYGSLDQGRAGAEYVPDATFHEVGVGHLPWLDEPERCGELVESFLERIR